MDFDEYVGRRTDVELATYSRLAVADTLGITQSGIISGELGGTQVHYRVSLRWRNTAAVRNILTDAFMSGMPDPCNGAYDYAKIAADKHADSTSTGLPVFELLRQGAPCRSEYHGNVVVPLSKLLDVVVSASGLSGGANQVFCLMVAANFQRRLVMAWYRMTHL